MRRVAIHIGNEECRLSHQAGDFININRAEEVPKSRTSIIATVHACTDYSDIVGRDTPPVVWGYDATDGPASWSHLDSSTYSLCGHGTHQSPIDLNDASATTVSLVNATNTLTFDSKTYKFAQFHFHVSSENRIEGEYFPMEVHFVHSTADGERAVIGFMIGVGCNNDPLLKSVVNHIDELQGEDPQTILPSLDFSTITAHFA
ncbi:hypothetical protein IFR05_011369 [Cadophora sp. M221]|nr:hypothetical protein IFR05_011369 [Cadophora sp. M221]